MPWPDSLDTRDPDVAFRHVTGCYVGVDNYDVLGQASAFRLNRRKLELSNWILVRGKLSTGYRMRALPGAHLVAMLPESGGLAMRAGRSVAESGRQRHGIVSPRERFSVEYHGASGYTLLVTHDHVMRRLEEMGESDALALINGIAPITLDLNAPAGVRFRGALNFVWAQLAGSANRFEPPPLLVAALEEVLCNGLMLLLSPKRQPDDAEAVSDPGRRVVLRACEMIRARVDEPVRIAEIASALNISARHLQAGFQRHLGKTPRAFLTECRLELARRMLLEGVPGRSVTAAALECGFSNLGEFSAKYRERFGEKPSETLRNAL